MNCTLSVRLARQSLAAAAAALCFIPVLAAAPSPSDSPTAQARYASERAACLKGESSQDRATCLKEAGAALADSRRAGAKTPDEDPQALAANAVRRCQAVAAADRNACEQMALGHGTVSGSVEGGGVITEYRTVAPAQ